MRETLRATLCDAGRKLVVGLGHEVAIGALLDFALCPFFSHWAGGTWHEPCLLGTLVGWLFVCGSGSGRVLSVCHACVRASK